MLLLSRFSMYLSCFFFMCFILLVFLITCTTSDFLRFSSCFFKFSLRLSFLFCFSSSLAAIIDLETSFILANSFLKASFFSKEFLTPLVLMMEENFVFWVFHTRPDFGFPLGTFTSGFWILKKTSQLDLVR